MKTPFLTTLFCLSTIFCQMEAWADSDDKQSCGDCGVVSAVQVTEKSGEGSGLGAAAGALAGGVLGNKVGGGGTAATIAGVAGGALAGHYGEKAVRNGGKEWNVTVKMDNGSNRTVTTTSEPTVRSGDRVRVAGSTVVRYEGEGKKSGTDHDHEPEHENEKHD